MKLAMRVPRSVVVAAVTLAIALGVAACGGSSSSSSSSSSSKSSGTTTTAGRTTAKISLAAYQTCLKSHGVTTTKRARGFGGGAPGGGTSTTGGPPSGTRPAGTFTRPSGTSTTGGIPGGAVAAGGNSKFSEAAKACASKLPKGARAGFGAGGPGGGARGAGADGASTFSRRELTSYVACIRKNGYAGMPEADTRKSASSVFPKSVETNAKFIAANRKCASLLTPASSTA